MRRGCDDAMMRWVQRLLNAFTRSDRIIASSHLSPHRKLNASPHLSHHRILVLAALLAGCSDSTEPNRNAPGPATRDESNPFAGARLYVNPASHAQNLVEQWATTRPADAVQMKKIADHAQADWLIDWNANVRPFVSERMQLITAAGALAVFVAYRIPNRNCNAASGAPTAEAYRQWVRDIAAGIGARKAVVVLEPDALAGMDCLNAADQRERIDLLKYAVTTLKAQPNVGLYIDAGTSAWQPVGTMATRLAQAGVSDANGFALNVANFQTNTSTFAFGDALSAATGGKHYIIDTSRNGRGPGDGEWCNPPGRGLGTAPTTNTGRATVDAVLWIKAPGESDGACNGGPAPGQFWPEYALGLAQRSAL